MTDKMPNTKIQTSEKQYGSTTDDYLDMLRRVHTYPGVKQITSIMYGITVIEFDHGTAAEMFLSFEGQSHFTYTT